MEIVHRVGKSSSMELASSLAKLGVEVATSGLVSFEVEETDERWPALRQWIECHGAFDSVFTKFSKSEMASVSWLELVPDWHNGYPQPDEGNFGYRRVTYDSLEYCDECGMCGRQVGPFQMSREPKWGRHGILQLNWVFDEFFVTPKVWSEVFAPFGIERRCVVTSKGDELETVVQIVIDEEVNVATDELIGESCGMCGHVRYLPHVRGMFPEMKSEPAGVIAKTVEVFGSGGSTHRRVLVNQNLRGAIQAAKIRGASFRPVADAIEKL